MQEKGRLTKRAGYLGMCRRQIGLITRDQLRAHGVSDRTISRLVQSGELIRVHRGVLRHISVPTSWEQALLAATFAVGRGCVVSHRAAAALWGFDAFTPGIVEVTSEKKNCARPKSVIVHFSSPFHRLDWVSRGVIPVTDPNRTLLDLGAVVPIEKVALAVESAVNQRLVRLPVLRSRLTDARRSGRRGITILDQILNGHPGDGPSASEFERMVYRQLANSDLPTPVRQHPMVLEGRKIYIDMAYPEAALAIEVDSLRWHLDDEQWLNDLWRRNALFRIGWGVYHVVWKDFKRDPHQVLRDIEVELRRRAYFL